MKKKFFIILPILFIVLLSSFFLYSYFFHKPSEVENIINTVNSYEKSIKNKDFDSFKLLSYFPQSGNVFMELISRGFTFDIKDKSVVFLKKLELEDMVLYTFNNKAKKTLYGILTRENNGIKIVENYKQLYNDGMEDVLKEIENNAKFDVKLYNKNLSKLNSLKGSSFDIEGNLGIKNLNLYNINISINGVDLGVESQSGSQSYIFTLFNKNHSYALEYGALYLSKYGSLIEGKNTVEINYKKFMDGESGIITLSLLNSSCPFQDFLNIDLGSSNEGDFKTEFNITKSMIEKCDFKTISIKK